jgi:hypothetical protein
MHLMDKVNGIWSNCDNNNNVIQFNSILYFNVLTQQLQEPIT